MKKIVLHGIEILFSESQESVVRKFVNAFNQNPRIFLSFLPKKISFDEKIFGFSYIDDLDSFLTYQIGKYYDQNCALKMVSDLERILHGLFYNLQVSIYDDEKKYNKPFSELSLDDIYASLALIFYDKNEFVDYIKNCDKQRKDCLYNLVRDKERVNMLNFLLSDIENALKNISPNIIDEVLELYDIYPSFYGDDLCEDEELAFVQSTPLNIMMTVSLFENYLLEIDDTGNYLQIFQDALNKGKIQFLRHNSDFNYNKSRVEDDTMMIYCNSTIEDFIVLAHEFFHYITAVNGKYNFSLKEFPSIYYELEAGEYLVSYGFSKAELENIRLKRFHNLQEEYSFLSDLLWLLDVKRRNGIITNTVLDEELKELTNLDVNNRRNLANHIVDQVQVNIIVNGMEIINVNSYLIGGYLSFLMKQASHQKEKMKYVLDNLDSITLKNVLNMFDYKKYFK